jgi:hypothetical protein
LHQKIFDIVDHIIANDLKPKIITGGGTGYLSYTIYTNTNFLSNSSYALDKIIPHLTKFVSGEEYIIPDFEYHIIVLSTPVINGNPKPPKEKLKMNDDKEWNLIHDAFIVDENNDTYLQKLKRDEAWKYILTEINKYYAWYPIQHKLISNDLIKELDLEHILTAKDHNLFENNNTITFENIINHIITTDATPNIHKGSNSGERYYHITSNQYYLNSEYLFSNIDNEQYNISKKLGSGWARLEISDEMGEKWKFIYHLFIHDEDETLIDEINRGLAWEKLLLNVNKDYALYAVQHNLIPEKFIKKLNLDHLQNAKNYNMLESYAKWGENWGNIPAGKIYYYTNDWEASNAIKQYASMIYDNLKSFFDNKYFTKEIKVGQDTLTFVTVMVKHFDYKSDYTKVRIEAESSIDYTKKYLTELLDTKVEVFQYDYSEEYDKLLQKIVYNLQVRYEIAIPPEILTMGSYNLLEEGFYYENDPNNTEENILKQRDLIVLDYIKFGTDLRIKKQAEAKGDYITLQFDYINDSRRTGEYRLHVMAVPGGISLIYSNVEKNYYVISYNTAIKLINDIYNYCESNSKRPIHADFIKQLTKYWLYFFHKYGTESFLQAYDKDILTEDVIKKYEYLINAYDHNLLEDNSTSNSFADALRTDMIEDFLKEVEEDPEYNIDEPEIIDLLDTDDGYNWQTYIQNDLENGIFIYWEGFSKYCWKAFCRKYPFKKKENIIQMFIDTRAKDLAKDFGYELIDADYFIAEDENAYGNEFKDYILKLTYKKI